MNSTPNRSALYPQYPHSPIRGLPALSKALGVQQDILIRYADIANQCYRLAKKETKADGSIRQTFDAFPLLKEIQTRIQQRILKKIKYPDYLQGSLKGCSPQTNAAIHIKSKIEFAEDIANFFPSAKAQLIEKIWSELLGFSQDVAKILTMLTTKNGALPQGAVTSSYLANLIFWSYEPTLVDKLRKRGLRYSRYVDDISVSSTKRLSIIEQTQLISEIYGMLLRHNFQPKRSKHEVFTAGRSMQTTKLLNNSRVALPSVQRSNIRAAVYALEKLVVSNFNQAEIVAELNSVTGRVGRLKSLHQSEGIKLKKRIELVRQKLTTSSTSKITNQSKFSNLQATETSNSPLKE